MRWTRRWPASPTASRWNSRPATSLTIRDNGRGIPTDPHPKFKNKSALEVIMTTLHAGGKFGGKVYDTSGGLHGVGASVVNALSDWMEVDVARDKHSRKMRFERGHAVGKLKDMGAVNRRGTIVSFHPDPQIFGQDCHFSPATLYRMVKSKAYLFRGVEIRWKCDPALIKGDTPAEDTLKFPGGLLDFLKSEVGSSNTVTQREFFGPHREQGRKRARWNGRRCGRRRSIPSCIPIATRSRHRRAARTSRACATR
ncbi:MAG: ATP-binding protein [Rhizomicrobium sp.]